MTEREDAILDNEQCPVCEQKYAAVEQFWVLCLHSMCDARIDRLPFAQISGRTRYLLRVLEQARQQRDARKRT